LSHILGAMNMISMHLMIQRQRLKLFGHIIRMKDERQVKQSLFGEIDAVRFRGRRNMQSIDCIVEDLKTFIISAMERNDCIVKWKAQDAMEIITRARERLMKEWMPTSNYWDPIRDRNEAFEIVYIRGCKKLGRTGYCLAQYK